MEGGGGGTKIPICRYVFFFYFPFHSEMKKFLFLLSPAADRWSSMLSKVSLLRRISNSAPSAEPVDTTLPWCKLPGRLEGSTPFISHQLDIRLDKT